MVFFICSGVFRCSLFDSQTAPYKYFVQGERAELQCLAKYASFCFL